MIYKTIGCIELEKLRIIHLFEADFNLAVGILFGQRRMHHQTDNTILNPGQYGKPGGERQDAAFAKLMHYHISRYTATAMSCFESDTAACFDRIVMDFALCCFFVWGAPKEALTMCEKTLHYIEHSIKTTFGISRQHYKYSKNMPIIGPDQGSRAAMGACTTITTPLLHTMDRLADRLCFTSPDQQYEYKTTAKIFVDNNRTYNNDFY